MKSSEADVRLSIDPSEVGNKDVRFLLNEIQALRNRVEILEGKVEHLSTLWNHDPEVWNHEVQPVFQTGNGRKPVSDDYSEIIKTLESITESNDFRRVYQDSELVAKDIMAASGGSNEKTAVILQIILNRMLSRYYEDPSSAGPIQDRFHINVNFLDDPIIIEMWLCNFLDFLFKQRFIDRYSSVKPVFDFIDEHIKEYINMSVITENCHLSQQYLLRLFKDRMRISAVEYIQSRKMMLAKWYLYFEEYSTLDVASKLGYVDAGYFSKVFRKYSGLTPYQYKMKVRRKT